jgi:hypothetical protein
MKDKRIIKMLCNLKLNDTHPINPVFGATANHNLESKIVRNFRGYDFYDATVPMNRDIRFTDSQNSKDITRNASDIYKKDSSENFKEFCFRNNVYKVINGKKYLFDVNLNDIYNLLAIYLRCDFECAKFIGEYGFSQKNSTLGFKDYLLGIPINNITNLFNMPSIYNEINYENFCTTINGLKGDEELVCEMEIPQNSPLIFDVWYVVKFIDKHKLPHLTVRELKVHYQIYWSNESRIFGFNKYEVGYLGQPYIDIKKGVNEFVNLPTFNQ